MVAFLPIAAGAIGLGGALAASLGAGQRSGGQYSQVDTGFGQDAAVKVQRGRLLARLQDQATGQGPSLVQMQANQALSDGRRQLQAMAASDRNNPALARRNAMLSGGQLSARINQNAMMGRLQERQQAEAALAQAIAHAQHNDNQRAATLQNAMNIRYQGAMGQPTRFEQAAGVLSATLPMIGKFEK